MTAKPINAASSKAEQAINMNLKQIEDEALHLPEDQRAELAQPKCRAG
jgi:hypothetical protein